NFQLHGAVYFHSPNDAVWTTVAGTTQIQGAVVAERSLSLLGGGASCAPACPTVIYNAAVLQTLNSKQGSLVRIPGSWRDFAAGS
ncbi:MAG TPA: hypothetical protein VFB50_17100, partial [Chloroflexota bacterium]|nr:hypothetical protein [Chloroflexota bacterium]